MFYMETIKRDFTHYLSLKEVTCSVIDDKASFFPSFAYLAPTTVSESNLLSAALFLSSPSNFSFFSS